MDCSGVVCKHCQGEIICLNCRPKQVSTCRNCGAEVSIVFHKARETFDPAAVEGLLLAIMDMEIMGVSADVTRAAQRVRLSRYHG